MKTSFLNTFATLLLLVITGVFTVTSCKCKRNCEGIDSITEQYLSPAIKTSVLGFSDTTKWVFRRVSDTTKFDTIFLGTQQIFPLEKGDCALSDKGKCCSDYYYEKSNRDLTVGSNSLFYTFNGYYTDEKGLWMKGSWGELLVEDRIYSQEFLQRFNQSLLLKISNKNLSDVNSGEEFLGETTPFSVHWSKQYGLVRYAYRSSTLPDTIVYERIDLPN